jgi:hypothetical protein
VGAHARYVALEFAALKHEARRVERLEIPRIRHNAAVIAIFYPSILASADHNQIRGGAENSSFTRIPSNWRGGICAKIGGAGIMRERGSDGHANGNFGRIVRDPRLRPVLDGLTRDTGRPASTYPRHVIRRRPGLDTARPDVMFNRI